MDEESYNNMALATNIEFLLNKQNTEINRIELERQDACKHIPLPYAFANDLDGLDGG